MNKKIHISAIIRAIGSKCSTKLAIRVKYRNPSLTQIIFLPTYGWFSRTRSHIRYFRNNYAYARTVRTRPSLPPRRPGNEARFNKTLEIKFDNKINKSLTSFLIQRLALDVKRGNVAGNHPSHKGLGGSWSLPTIHSQ